MKLIIYQCTVESLRLGLTNKHWTYDMSNQTFKETFDQSQGNCYEYQVGLWILSAMVR